MDAGPRAGGYVEPSEAAWEAIEKVVAPYFRDLERRVQLRHEDEATERLRGDVAGNTPAKGPRSAAGSRLVATSHFPLRSQPASAIW